MVDKNFRPFVLEENRHIARERFGLSNGQFFAVYVFKNLWWTLDGKTIGFGDLKNQHIDTIVEKLEDGEEFLGWNEHHGTSWQQFDEPMIKITKGNVSFPRQAAQREA